MKYFAIAAAAILIASCSTKTEGAAEAELKTETEIVNDNEAAPALSIAKYGEDISEDGAVGAADIIALLEGKDSVQTKIVGPIEKVCQVKGCWMTMRVSEDVSMHVSFKDYGFFVPKDIDGKVTVIEGYAYRETMSVDDLKHYAEDEGKTQEEIDAITEPETNLSFVADGVVVLDYQAEVENTEESQE